MAFDKIITVGGIELTQNNVDITDKTDNTLVADSTGKIAKIFKLILTSDGGAKFSIRSGSQKVADIYVRSDTTFEDSNYDFRWPVFQGNLGSDLRVDQSDLSSLTANAYIQYRYD